MIGPVVESIETDANTMKQIGNILKIILSYKYKIGKNVQ